MGQLKWRHEISCVTRRLTYQAKIPADFAVLLLRDLCDWDFDLFFPFLLEDGFGKGLSFRPIFDKCVEGNVKRQDILLFIRVTTYHLARIIYLVYHIYQYLISEYILKTHLARTIKL